MDDPSTREVIESYRTATRCREATRSANLRAIEARLEAADAPANQRGAIPPAWIVAGTAAAAAVLVVWLGRGTWWSSSAQQAAEANDAAMHEADADRDGKANVRTPANDRDTIPATDHEATPDRDTTPAELVVPASPATATTHDSAVATRRGRAPTATPGAPTEPATTPSPDAASIEAALLMKARVALDAGAITEANAALDRHRRDFPRGMLAEERWLLQVRADCNASPDRARSTAAAFHSAFPGSRAATRLAADPCPSKKP